MPEFCFIAEEVYHYYPNATGAGILLYYGRGLLSVRLTSSVPEFCSFAEEAMVTGSGVPESSAMEVQPQAYQRPSAAAAAMLHNMKEENKPSTSGTVMHSAKQVRRQKKHLMQPELPVTNLLQGLHGL